MNELAVEVLIEKYDKQIAQLTKERDQLAAKCAEMRDVITHLSQCIKDDECYLSDADIAHALSDQCGTGWLSPEKKKSICNLMDRIIGFGRGDMGIQELCDYTTETAEQVKEICK